MAFISGYDLNYIFPYLVDRWTQVLRWVPVTRVQQSWAEFCGDKVKMQGVEAMQKQLLIREKRSTLWVCYIAVYEQFRCECED